MKKPSKRLSLATQTIRVLQSEGLEQVYGGSVSGSSGTSVISGGGTTVMHSTGTSIFPGTVVQTGTSVISIGHGH